MTGLAARAESAPPLPLGAHVSTQGGLHLAPERGARIGATAIQIFTTSPNQWRQRVLTTDETRAFRDACARAAITVTVAHDSYLINLATPDPTLWRRSRDALIAELERCRLLGIPFLVSHPGNYGTDRAAGLARNARGYAEALAAASHVTILIEGTAGAGTALGASFAELAAIRAAIPSALRGRTGVCLDTAHLHAAGYDLVRGWEAVWDAFDRTVGQAHLACLHLNDARGPRGSRRDRHEWIGEGALGPAPFRRLMQEARFAEVIKIIETPKGDDPMRHDRRMLRRLRAYARRGSRAGRALADR